MSTRSRGTRQSPLPLRLGFLVAVPLLASACSRDPDHPHDHDGGHGVDPAGDHEHELEAIAVSVWRDGFELFYEHPPLVVGEPAKFAVHVTSLETFLPRKDGRVTFVVADPSGRAQELVVERPARPGIYGPVFTFSTAGEHRFATKIAEPSGDVTIELPTLTVHATADDAAHAAAALAAAPEPDGVPFLKEQQWKLPLRTAVATRRTLVERLRVPGTVLAAPGRSAEVVAPIAGRVAAPEGRTLPALGERLDAGALLAMVEPPLAGADWIAFESNRLQRETLAVELAAKIAEAEAARARAAIDLERTAAAVDRLTPLVEAEARSRRELAEAEYEARAADAEHAAAVELAKGLRAALDALPTSARAGEVPVLPAVPLRAPIAGRVVAVAAALGEQVAAGASLVSIVDASEVLVRAELLEHDLEHLTSTPRGEYLAPFDSQRRFELPSEPPPIWLPVVDPVKHTVRLLFHAPNEDGRLAIGMFVDLFLETHRADEGLAIPRSAVIDVDGRPVAYVQLEGELFEARDLEVGIEDGDWIEVTSGLGEGERVVSDGAMAVRLAALSGTIPEHGHAH